jgi:uncharacterized protein YhfF
MVLFRPELIDAILAGRKTQTRRIWRTAQVRIGGVYPVQRHLFDKKEVAPCWLLVTGLRKEAIGKITEDDARAEGYAGRAEFLAAWQRNFQRPHLDQEVYVVTFAPVPRGFEFFPYAEYPEARPSPYNGTLLPCANCDGEVTIVRARDDTPPTWTHWVAEPEPSRFSVECANRDTTASPRPPAPTAVASAVEAVV